MLVHKVFEDEEEEEFLFICRGMPCAAVGGITGSPYSPGYSSSLRV